MSRVLLASIAFLFCVGAAFAEEPTPAAGAGQGVQAALDREAGPASRRPDPVAFVISEERVRCRDHDPQRRPFFGDTHVHTALSFDARTQDTRNRPRDAYRFARGEKLGIQPYDSEGNPTRFVQLDRPLDFTALSDHSEFLGDVHVCTTPGTWNYWHPVCIAFRHSPTLGLTAIAMPGLIYGERWGFCGEDGEVCRASATDVWSEVRAAAEEAYDRSEECRFTSFVGYEFTASVGEGQNLHRNVIFRNEKVPALPASWIETPSAWELWNRLERECVEGIPGCDALTIPHNSNLSGGLMFESARVTRDHADGVLSGAALPIPPMQADEAGRRSRWEPLVEVMQHKGESECDSRAGWANDEFCDFEKLPYDRFGAKTGVGTTELVVPPASSYVRDALKQGLAHEKELGANPFRFGLISATDTHVAAPGQITEEDHPGHGGAGMHAGAIAKQGLPDDIEYGPGGLAVLWAEENSRDALFAAMQRREAYATSGSRPVVRFFGGWDFDDALCGAPDFVEQSYASGVPMGGVLPAAPSGAGAPRFLVHALQDPGGGRDAGLPLQRIQIIKGWLEGEEVHEKVLDVAGGPNGADVDPRTCRPRGEGASVLCSVWTDPDFDPSEGAFYYARVLENPRCRWSEMLCLEAGVDCGDVEGLPEGLRPCCDENYQKYVQDRAWTSPIWYSPGS